MQKGVGNKGRETTPAANSTAPVRQLLGSANAKTTPAGTQAAWALGVMNPTPKDQGSISINTLRPICLQNVIFKWASATILLMMEDIVTFATPPPTESIYQTQRPTERSERVTVQGPVKQQQPDGMPHKGWGCVRRQPSCPLCRFPSVIHMNCVLHLHPPPLSPLKATIFGPLSLSR